MVLDYYIILGVDPKADLGEIKAAYRKLAHQYHPDKNENDQSAVSKFNLVKEAYETLSNPEKKQAYLEERWLQKAYERQLKTAATKPEHILMRVLQEGNQIRQLDIYRKNNESIREKLSNLLSSDHLTILNDFNETSINDAIVDEMLHVIQMLPASDEQFFLKRLTLINSHLQNDIKDRFLEVENKLFWETWRPAFIILIVVLICILIWGTSLRN